MDEFTIPMVQGAHVTRWDGDVHQSASDFLAIEHPLEICLNDHFLAVTMRTPGSDRDLAVGFAVSEGIIRSADDLYDVTLCKGEGDSVDAMRVTLIVPEERVPMDLGTRSQQYSVSACGLCGRALVDQIFTTMPVMTNVPKISRTVICGLPAKLRSAQRIFSQTGGLHGAAIFDAAGNCQFHAEDVGRHNAVDKAIGQAVQSASWPLTNHILMVSGRAGFEIIQKAAMARISFVCAVSAPSSLAVDAASQCGITLIGFLRDDKMNIYSYPERILNS